MKRLCEFNQPLPVQLPRYPRRFRVYRVYDEYNPATKRWHVVADAEWFLGHWRAVRDPATRLYLADATRGHHSLDDNGTGYGICPICGEVIELQVNHQENPRRTTDGRLIGSCEDAFTREQWESVPVEA